MTLFELFKLNKSDINQIHKAALSSRGDIHITNLPESLVDTSSRDLIGQLYLLFDVHDISYRKDRKCLIMHDKCRYGYKGYNVSALISVTHRKIIWFNSGRYKLNKPNKPTGKYTLVGEEYMRYIEYGSIHSKFNKIDWTYVKVEKGGK